jgi:hypothetical protein
MDGGDRPWHYWDIEELVGEQTYGPLVREARRVSKWKSKA